MVSAPAGSGKTLMLADWVRSGEGPETAWISLDADDNDPRRLWSAVLTSLLALPSMSAGEHSQDDVEEGAPLPTDADLVESLAEMLDDLDRAGARRPRRRARADRSGGARATSPG